MTGNRLSHWLMISVLAAATTASGLSAAKPVSVGTRAPDFSVQLFNGATKRLADYQGKVLVLNYWATWCGPCKAEMPMMSRFHKRNKARGFEIIGIVTRDSIAQSQLKRVEAALSYPLAKSLKGKYGIINGAVPTSYVIDRNGVIRYAQAGGFEEIDFKDILEPLLDE
jgi:cytochrome c biogenesis protein CcmG, thiol:disulfide interchange protein DsbE